jgi:hypothetical protein
MPRRDSGSGGGSSVVGSIFRSLTSLFFVGVSVMCVYNVFGVGEEVEKLAKEVACQGQPLPCDARYTKAERTPWAHSFRMYRASKTGNSEEKDVVCQRQYILAGDYACKYKGEPDRATIGPDAASSANPVGSSASSSSPIQIRLPAKVKATAAPKAPVAPAGSAGP